MSKKKIKPQSAKNKGRKFQHWIAEKISELTGYSYGSAGQDKEIESRPMGQSGTDIRMESHVLKKFPYSIEAKHQENWSVHQWIQQAKENQMQGTDWLLFCKRNRKDPVVIMDAEVFFELLKKKENVIE